MKIGMKLSFCVILLALLDAVPAQTGGSYDMSHNVMGGSRPARRRPADQRLRRLPTLAV